MIVPPSRPAVHHGDEANSGLHQTPRQHQLTADAKELAVARIAVFAIKRFHRVRLAIERESLARRERADDFICLVVEITHCVKLGWIRLERPESALHHYARLFAGVETL